jgi:hypothetical protein
MNTENRLDFWNGGGNPSHKLLLKNNRDGELTVYWYALGPVNEQLHSLDDPWLLWVRKQVDPSN